MSIQKIGAKSMGITGNESPQQLIDLVDRKFNEAKKKNISRFSVEWGAWSRQMNLFIREKIDGNHPKHVLFRYVMFYWTIKSQLLELYHLSRIGKLGKKNQLKKDSVTVKQFVLNPPEDLKLLPDIPMENLGASIVKDYLFKDGGDK
jgi:hypothetical protein